LEDKKEGVEMFTNKNLRTRKGKTNKSTKPNQTKKKKKTSLLNHDTEE
jgi:hypothetical protein